MGHGGALEQELERVEMRAPRDGIGILCDGVHDGVENGVDDAVCQGLWLVLAVEQGAVCFGSRDGGRIAHVMLERIVDIELDVVHGGGDCEGTR